MIQAQMINSKGRTDITFHLGRRYLPLRSMEDLNSVHDLLQESKGMILTLWALIVQLVTALNLKRVCVVCDSHVKK